MYRSVAPEALISVGSASIREESGGKDDALAAMQAEGGRRFVGCDVDLEVVRRARGRLGRCQ